MELQVADSPRNKGARAAVAVIAIIGLALLAAAPASSAVPGTDVLYTLDADFDQGTLVNVNHDAVHDQLQLNENTSTFPFVWVALSQRCTIAKIDTRSGEILGEYRTISDEASCFESSRTTVGLDGSVWVGHRGPGGATHVGLPELNGCIDRNGNGTIETSTEYGDVKAWLGTGSDVAEAEDECIIHHVNTDVLGFGDTRHVSIDANNKLWVGSYSGKRAFVRVNGSTGALETSPRVQVCGGYGGLIDGAGVIWSANGSNSGLLRWDPNAADSATNPRCLAVTNYGLAVDPDGSIWATNLGAQLYKISPDGNTILGPFSHGANSAQGLATTADGDIWVSSSLFCGGSGCTVGHVKNDGTFVGNVPNPTGAGSTGVAVDSAGKVWTANRSSHTATRIDPAGGPIGSDGSTRVGAVDLTVDFPAGPDGRPLPYPYNYSDMTGAQLLTSTSPQGTWTVVQDGGSAGRAWGRVILNGSVPDGAKVTIEARVADTEAGLGGQPFVEVTSDQAFSLSGRFIQVRVTLEPTTDGVSPVVFDVRICDVNGCQPESAPVPAAVAAAAAAAPAGAVLGAQKKSCISRRSFRIRIRRPGGKALRSAQVFVNGKRVRVVRGARLRSPVNLRGLPKGLVRVRITVTTVDGKRVTGTRSYLTCVPRRPGDGPPRPL